MGICLSCLGRGPPSDTSDSDQDPLIPADPFAQHTAQYGSTIQAPATNTRDPETLRKEQEAIHNIQRWASDQIVDIFPNATANLTPAIESSTESIEQSMTQSMHQEFLLSTIPGDRSKRSIRIYPSRVLPREGETTSVGSGTSGTTRLKGKEGSRAVVKLNIDLP